MILPPLRALNPFTAAEIYRMGCAANQIISPMRETYSQHGEDLIIGSMLEVMVRRKGLACKDIRYIDIGANHPIEISNTYLFYRVLGSGVLFEADPHRISELKRVRPRDMVVHAAITTSCDPTVTLHVANASECSSLDGTRTELCDGLAFVEQVEVPNLHVMRALYEYWPINKEVQLLSIDIEGMDLQILMAIDFKMHRPWIVCAESAPRGYSEPMAARMKAAGYVLVAMTADNHIFGRLDLMEG